MISGRWKALSSVNNHLAHPRNGVFDQGSLTPMALRHD